MASGDLRGRAGPHGQGPEGGQAPARLKPTRASGQCAKSVSTESDFVRDLRLSRCRRKSEKPLFLTLLGASAPPVLPAAFSCPAEGQATTTERRRLGCPNRRLPVGPASNNRAARRRAIVPSLPIGVRAPLPLLEALPSTNAASTFRPGSVSSNGCAAVHEGHRPFRDGCRLSSIATGTWVRSAPPGSRLPPICIGLPERSAMSCLGRLACLAELDWPSR